MKKICLMILPAFFSLFAQQQLTPPPTQITLPSDSLQTRAGQAQKLAADSSQLKLPDVVVTGQDKSRRQIDQKKSGSNEQPRLLAPGEAYAPLSGWLRRSNERQGMDESPFKKQMSWFVLQAGSYSHLLGRLGHWRKLTDGQFHGHGWLEQSNGQYNNSQYQQFGLSGKLEYQMTEKVKGQLQFEYERFSRNLHGAVQNGSQRHGGQGGLDLKIALDPRPLTNVTVHMQVRGLGLRTDTTGFGFDESDDFYYHLQADLHQVWSGWQLSLHAGYLHEAYDSWQKDASLLASFGDAEIEALYPFSRRLQFSGGFGIQSMHADSGVSKSAPAPFLRLRYAPHDRFALAVQGQSGLLYQTYTQRRQENPYAAHDFTMAPEESNFSLRLESELSMTHGAHLQVVLIKNWLERMQFWQRDAKVGLFDLHQGSGTLSEIHLRFTTDLTEASQMSLSVSGYSDHLDETAAGMNDHVPYRPSVQASLQGRYVFTHGWSVRATTEYWGKRYSGMNTKERLPDFALLQAGVQKQLGRFISAWVTMQNMTNSKYVYWQQYPETGFACYAGIRAQF